MGLFLPNNRELDQKEWNKEIKKTLVELLNINGIKIIELNNVFYLWTAIKLASDRMALLNLER